MAITKRAYYKIFQSDGTYITTWRDDVISSPSFVWSINGSMGEQVIRLARTSGDFGETDDVAMFNQVETWVQDGDNPSGIRIHNGYILTYDITIESNGTQYIDVHVVSFTNELDITMLKDGSATTVSYSSADPADIFKGILNKAAQTITYNSGSIENAGTTISYTFKYITCLDALKKAVQFTPAYWYWYVDAGNLFHLSSTDFDTVDHKLFVGQQIQSIQFSKTTENLYNAVYFLGGDTGGGTNLYRKYNSTTSQTEYGVREYRIQDGRVTTAATAEAISQKFLDENDHFEQTLTAVVIDNNGSDGSLFSQKGYDIELLKPGDVVQILDARTPTQTTLWYDSTGTTGNMVWDVSFWDYNIIYSLGIPMQIQTINYQFNTAILTLSTRLPDIAKRIEDLEDDLITLESDGIPTTPS